MKKNDLRSLHFVTHWLAIVVDSRLKKMGKSYSSLNSPEGGTRACLQNHQSKHCFSIRRLS